MSKTRNKTTVDQDRADLELFLRRQGIFDKLHRHGTRPTWFSCCMPPSPPIVLGTHLLGVYDLLKKYNSSTSTCIAGGLHSVYGTNIFKGLRASDERRKAVISTFGESPARLVYLFSTINRPIGLETGRLVDVKSGELVVISSAELHALRLIEAANLIDQSLGGQLHRDYPSIAAVWDEHATAN